MDENFVAKLLDVGSEIEVDEGRVLVEPGEAVGALFMVLHGTLLVETAVESYERGAGSVVGYVEKLDGSDDVRVSAKTEARLVVVDRSSYEAAVSG